MPEHEILTATGETPTIWFEDMAEGQVYDLGTVVADRDEIVEFARKYDPQWYHLDEQRAADSTWGGLIASGWWTGSVVMRLYVDGFLAKAAPDASPGMEGMRWRKAVYAGDELHIVMTILQTGPSSRGDHLGTARLKWDVTVDGELVADVIGRGWFHRRPSTP